MGRTLLIAAGSVLAALVALVVVLATRSSGVGALRAPATVSTATTGGGSQPLLPPHDALTLAAQDGSQAVAVAVQPSSVTTTVIGADGNGVTGLDVRVRADGGAPAASSPCGPGCYRAALASAHPRLLDVSLGDHDLRFVLPARSPAAGSLLTRIASVFERARAVSYSERLSSGPTHVLQTRWRFEAPNRASYDETSGGAASGIVVAGQRWDRDSDDAQWVRTQQSPQLREPREPWGDGVFDVRVLERSARRIRLSLVDPVGPVWYVVTADPSTLRISDLRMTAAAHFMHDAGFRYDDERRIRPPVSAG
jgi:hypothetical protein